MSKINTALRAHYSKLIVALLSGAVVVITGTADSLAKNISDRLAGGSQATYKMYTECKRTDSLIKSAHIEDVVAIKTSIESMQRTQSELIRKIDVQGAKMDGYMQAIRSSMYISAEEAKKDTTRPCNVASLSE